FLADDGESEVTRLDCARVDGPHRYLVHAIPFDAHKFVGIGDVGRRRRKCCTRAKGKCVGLPGRVTHPGPHVSVIRARADEVECGTLHARSCGKHFLETRVPSSIAYWQFKNEYAALPLQSGA